jgi:hypothetical protein
MRIEFVTKNHVKHCTLTAENQDEIGILSVIFNHIEALERKHPDMPQMQKLNPTYEHAPTKMFPQLILHIHLY